MTIRAVAADELVVANRAFFNVTTRNVKFPSQDTAVMTRHCVHVPITLLLTIPDTGGSLLRFLRLRSWWQDGGFVI
jgi:hypothetical protein